METETLDRQATGERIRAALEDGGRAVVTVRSKETDRHVTVRLAAKKRKPGEDRGWLSRATRAGRVGIGEADAVFVDDPTLEWPDGKVATLWTDTGQLRPARDADPARLWAAEKVLAFAHGRYDLSARADVYLAAECCYCGKTLTDPESVERGIGPECYGRHTGSRSAERPEAPSLPPSPRLDPDARSERTGPFSQHARGDAERVTAGRDRGREEERRMQEAEARGDREQTRREEEAKHRARAAMEAGPVSDAQALQDLTVRLKRRRFNGAV